VNESDLKIIAEREEREKTPWMWWHWQNLNDKKGRGQGSGLRHGRCWWHFRTKSRRPGPTIQFSWNLWSHFCGIGVDWDDEDLTFSAAFPPFAFWLSFSTNFAWIDKLLPHKVLSPNYPDTIVVDEREIAIKIHNGCVWIHPYSKSMEWAKADPWWVRGINFSINPFEAKHQRHEVRRADGSWVPYVGSWEVGPSRGEGIGGQLGGKEPDGREEFKYPYTYVRKNGEVQQRTATVFVDRRAWRPRCLQWTSLFENQRQCIDVSFDDEVGERSGSWKGGTVGCGYEMLRGETPEECLRRMEKERKF